MAADIFAIDEAIKTFIETYFPLYLDAQGVTVIPDAYILGYPNPAKYLYDITAYVLPFEFVFRQDGNFTSIEIPVEIFFTFKNQEDGYETGKGYLQYFFDFINSNKSLGGAVDIAYITAAKYFDGIEGNESVKADKIDLTIKIIQ